MSDETQNESAPAETESGDAPVTETQTQETTATASAAATTTEDDKSWQRRHDRLLQEIKPILGYTKSYGADGVAGFLKQFETALGNPTLGPLIQQLLKTGSVELPKPKTNEWDEPVQEPEWKSAMNPLLSELQTVRQELTAMKAQTGMARVTNHTAQFLKEWPLSDTERAHFASAMEEKLASFTNNPNGASILQNMDYRTFEAIALPEIKDSIRDIVRRQASSERTQAAAKATDAPGINVVGKEIKPNGAPPKSVEELRRSVIKAFSEGLLQ